MVNEKIEEKQELLDDEIIRTYRSYIGKHVVMKYYDASYHDKVGEIVGWIINLTREINGAWYLCTDDGFGVPILALIGIKEEAPTMPMYLGKYSQKGIFIRTKNGEEEVK